MLFKSLLAERYRVDNIAGWQYDNSSETQVYRIRRPYVSYREYTRTFAMYDWEGWTTPYFDALDVMEINGRVLDGDSWSLKASFYAPDSGEEARARGLYQRQRNARGVVYRWGEPSRVSSCSLDGTVVRGNRQVDRRHSTDGDHFVDDRVIDRRSIHRGNRAGPANLE